MSTPSIRTEPAVGSAKRGMSATRVDLPLPVLPTMAVVWPGRAVNEMSRTTGSSAPGYA